MNSIISFPSLLSQLFPPPVTSGLVYLLKQLPGCALRLTVCEGVTAPACPAENLHSLLNKHHWVLNMFLSTHFKMNGENQRCQEAKYHVRKRLTAIASNDEYMVQAINSGTEEWFGGSPIPCIPGRKPWRCLCFALGSGTPNSGNVCTDILVMDSLSNSSPVFFLLMQTAKHCSVCK